MMYYIHKYRNPSSECVYILHNRVGGGGVSQLLMVVDMGGGGVQNTPKIDYIIYECSLTYYTKLYQYQQYQTTITQRFVKLEVLNFAKKIV